MYAKIFVQILDSSLAENYHIRHMFEDMLKLCDMNGVVDMTFGAIARRLKMPEKSVRLYISELEKPDPDSRTPNHQGKRIVRLDAHREWGWFIVNHGYYRQLASDEQRREKTRVRTDKWRKKKACDAPVTLGDASDAIQIQKHIQKQKNKTEEVVLKELPSHLNTARMQNRWQVWMNHRRAFKKPGSWLNLFNEQIDWLSKLDEPTAHEALDASIRNGWQGLFEPKLTGKPIPPKPKTINDTMMEEAIANAKKICEDI